MTTVLVTGMSGTGKSTVLRALAARGHRTVDTDADRWSRWVTLPDGDRDWIWDEAAMTALLSAPRSDALIVAGCRTNQGEFYHWFDDVVLLSAPAAVLLSRVSTRTDNPYGRTSQQRQEIVHYLDTVEPLLRAGATCEIDATLPIAEVADRVEALLI
jgi:shikimate kinase